VKHARHNLAAFTLIEMMIVVVILGLLTTAAVLSFARPLREARLRDAIEQIRAADADARRAAKHFNKDVTLTIRLEDRVIERREAGVGGATARTALPNSVRLEEVRIGTSTAFDDALLEVSPMGLSPTWAVKIASDDRSQWLVFAGMSGQMAVLNDESRMAQLLSR
jgi:prepilin-type N-terminal cleavage/methylation domain-containing protein